MADTCACHHTTCAPHIPNDLCMHRRHGSQVARAEAPRAPERRRKMLRHTPCTDCAATRACCCCRHILCFGCTAVRARTCCRHAARQVPIALFGGHLPRLTRRDPMLGGINGVETGFARREAGMAGPVFGRWRGTWAFGAAIPLAGAAEGLGGTDPSTPRRSTRCVQLHCVCARLAQRRHAMVPSGLPAARDGQCCVRGACSAHLQLLCAAQWSGASRHQSVMLAVHDARSAWELKSGNGTAASRLA